MADCEKRVRRGLAGKAQFLNAQTVQAIGRDGFIVVDLRAEADYNKRHLDGAINMPYGSFADQWFSGFLKDTGKKFIFVCYSGQTSAWVAALLHALGWETYTMRGGMNAVK